jgi:hypothetical protein
MYLASSYIVLDLEPKIAPFDRNRVLRFLREKLRQTLSSKTIIHLDENKTSLVIALFDNNYERIKKKLEEIQEKLEAAGEARVCFHQEQIFCWFNGKFVETSDSIIYREKKIQTDLKKSQEKTIVYKDQDEETLPSFPSRFSRKNLKIPTRK